MALRRKGRGRVVRRVIYSLFAAILVGCAFAVLYLGTSTGLTFGGGATRIEDQSGTHPLYGQVGWLRNTAPWPITITSITTNVQHGASSVGVYILPDQTPPLHQSSKEPVWALNADKVPYQLNGGILRYLGFSLLPERDQVADISSITVEYSGPLGLHFHKTFSGTRVATASSTLPTGLLGVAPYGNPGSLDAYIAAIRAALTQPDEKTVAKIMGNGATPAQVQAFMTSEKAYTAAYDVTNFVVTPDGREQRLSFYKGDPIKGALPPIEVIWSNYRWTIQPPG